MCTGDCFGASRLVTSSVVGGAVVVRYGSSRVGVGCKVAASRVEGTGLTSVRRSTRIDSRDDRTGGRGVLTTSRCSEFAWWLIEMDVGDFEGS